VDRLEPIFTVSAEAVNSVINLNAGPTFQDLDKYGHQSCILISRKAVSYSSNQKVAYALNEAPFTSETSDRLCGLP
jgi:hypothetical protein